MHREAVRDFARGVITDQASYLNPGFLELNSHGTFSRGHAALTSPSCGVNEAGLNLQRRGLGQSCGRTSSCIARLLDRKAPRLPWNKPPMDSLT